MSKNALMIDLDDERAAQVAEVIGNKTCRKILVLLAEKEMSESEIASETGMPMNTVNYNVKKLREAGLIDPIKGFLWSVKGKRIHKYRVANKKIIISPRVSKGIIPVAVVSLIIAGGLKVWTEVAKASVVQGTRAVSPMLQTGNSGGVAMESSKAAADYSAEMVEGVQGASEGFYSKFLNYLSNAPNSWEWFLIGALTVIVLLVLWGWRERK